jgi:hypothetical protein
MIYKEKLPQNFFETQAEQVDIVQAQAVVLRPNFRIPNEALRAYLGSQRERAAEHHLPIFCFSLGDFTDTVRFDPSVRAFRLSVYRSSMSPQDIVMPTLIEDHAQEGITLRNKRGKPIVSFCGMGGFSSWDRWLKYYLKNAFYSVWGMFKPVVRARKLGVYWRRRAMRACMRSSLVEANFIIRSSYSGDLRTIELDPARARQEYLENIVESDFVLAPKGDGNYSNRFLEVLSLGRIPVVVDTDIALPLEDVIDYSKIMVRVPMDKVGDTARYISKFYGSLSEEEWAERQRLARDVFEKYLRQDSYFDYFFRHCL